MEREIRNDQQFDRFILRCHGPQFVALAQWGYAQHGRGAVLLDLTREAGAGYTTGRYLPAAQLIERIRGSTNVHEWQRFLYDVATYDPQRTLLVVIARPGGV
jgi:hypothetical protein